MTESACSMPESTRLMPERVGSMRVLTFPAAEGVRPMFVSDHRPGKVANEAGTTPNWKTMDLLVGSLLKTNPAFVTDYQKVRMVISPPSSKVAAICTVKMEGTGELLANVVLESPLGTYRTGKTGRTLIKTAVEGSTTFLVTRPGFEAQQVAANFIQGETTRLLIILKTAA